MKIAKKKSVAYLKLRNDMARAAKFLLGAKLDSQPIFVTTSEQAIEMFGEPRAPAYVRPSL